MNDNDRVVVYAEMNHGGNITEKELRGIVKMFQDRGFDTAWYERLSAHRWVRTIQGLAGKAKKTWDEL